MSEKKLVKKERAVSADWFVQGALSKIGDIFDRLTGRGWTKASSLSASELVERLKLLLDSEVKDLGDKGKFVPHHIKLKMQWNKFSTDSEEGMKRLEYELLAAAIDHINDNLYHTYKPLKIEVKPDYFTEGVKFIAGFDEFGNEETEVEVNVTAPQLNVQNLIPHGDQKTVEDGETYIAEFTIDAKSKSVELKFNESKKRMGVGRTKENDLVIEDSSISKIHAALVLNPQKMLVVADTGSTNGTFINGQRIAYGRAFPIGETDKLKFGNIEVFMRRVPKPTDFAIEENYIEDIPKTEAYQLSPQPTEAPIQLTEASIQPTEASIQPTVASQISPQPTEPVVVAPPIPKVPEYNFEEKNESNDDEMSHTQQNIVKLNFDE